MAGICGPNPILHLHRTTTQSPLNLHRVHGGARWCCCSVSPENENKTRTPPLLRLAVSGVTELLRLFSSSAQGNRADYQLKSEDRDENSASDIDDVLRILKADYENAYFVTGNFSSAIYAEDCLFEDPTIRFRGKELFSRNLKLLVPFFDSPSIRLQKIEKGANMETDFVAATWRLRTYLKLPWRPLISVNGSTIYELDEKLKIVRHAESWDVTALEAIGQIFTPSIGRPNECLSKHHVVEWESGKEGCTIHVSPDQLWPHTKVRFFSCFVSEGGSKLKMLISYVDDLPTGFFNFFPLFISINGYVFTAVDWIKI